MKIKYSNLIAFSTIFIGFGVIGVSTITKSIELITAISIAGIGIICSGIGQLAQVEDRKHDEEKHQETIAKLEEI